MSLRMDDDTFRTYRRVTSIMKWTVIYWFVLLTWLVPACRETLPASAQYGFNQLDALVE